MFSMCVQPLLLSLRSSFHFQTELAVNTHVAVAGMCDNVSKIREEVSGQVRSVSPSLILSTSRKCLQSRRSKPGWQPRSPRSQSSDLLLHLACLESHPRLRRGHVSVATN